MEAGRAPPPLGKSFPPPPYGYWTEKTPKTPLGNDIGLQVIFFTFSLMDFPRTEKTFPPSCQTWEGKFLGFQQC